MEFDNQVVTQHVLSHLTNADFIVLRSVSRGMSSFVSRLRDDNYLHFLRVRHLWSYYRDSHSDIVREDGVRRLMWKNVYACSVLLLRGQWNVGYGHDEAETALQLYLEEFHAVDTAMIIACTHGYPNVVATVLAEPYLTSSQMKDHLYTACEKSQCEVVKLLLEDKRMDPNDNIDLLIYACADGQERAEVVRLLLEDGRWDPTRQDDSCLWEAVRNGHLETVRLLLQDGRTDPDAHLMGNLVRLADKGRVDILELFLLDPRVDPVMDNSWPMTRACEAGQTEVVRLLLRDGRCDIIANRCIERAWYGGHTDVIRLLMADPRVDSETYEAYHPDKVWSFSTRTIIAGGLAGLFVGCVVHWYMSE